MCNFYPSYGPHLLEVKVYQSCILLLILFWLWDSLFPKDEAVVLVDEEEPDVVEPRQQAYHVVERYWTDVFAFSSET